MRDTHEAGGYDIKKVIVDFDIPLSPRTSTRFVLGAFSILSQRAFLWTDVASTRRLGDS